MNERIPRVNKLLKEEVGKIVLREVDLPENVLVTVTRAEATLNLQQARIYISVVPEDRVKEVLRVMNYSVFDVQQILNKKLRMRPVPRIEWVAETKTREAEKIEKLLSEIQKKNYNKH